MILTQRSSLFRNGYAFTMAEFVIALGAGVILVAALIILTGGMGRTLLSITSQITHNQNAGNGIEVILSRIQMANFASNDPSGNALTLSFDDDPEVDSDGDQVTWNDQNHFERFGYVPVGTNWNVIENNFIFYATNITSTISNIVVPSSVRKLPGQSIFYVSNNTVWINFGLLTTNATPFSQAVEIRTKGTFRNKLK